MSEVAYEVLASRISTLETEMKENSESHGKIYARLETVEKGHAVMDVNLNNILVALREIQADVKDLKSKPGKRFDKVVDTVVQWLIVAILGAAMIFK